MTKQFWLVLKDYYDKAHGVFKINNEIDDESLIKITRGVNCLTCM
jgi:hypothetical protein